MERTYLFIILIAFSVTILQIYFFPEFPDSEYVNLEQGKLAYTEYHSDVSNKFLIMIHGSPGSKDANFKNLALELEGYHIYALDMYGFGESEKNVKNYGMTSQAKVVSEFMQKMNIEKATVLGYSWGGLVAEQFAYLYPEKTDSLILLSAAGIQRGEPTRSFFIEKARSFISYPFVVYYPGSFSGDIGWRKGFMRSFIDSDQRPIEEQMKEIKVPTLIVHGKQDTIVEPWVAEEHHKLIPNSQLEFFEGWHGEFKTNPSEVAQIINEYEKQNYE